MWYLSSGNNCKQGGRKDFKSKRVKLSKPTGHVMHQQVQELYAIPTLNLCVLYLSVDKQRLVPLTPYTDWFL